MGPSLLLVASIVIRGFYPQLEGYVSGLQNKKDHKTFTNLPTPTPLSLMPSIVRSKAFLMQTSVLAWPHQGSWAIFSDSKFSFFYGLATATHLRIIHSHPGCGSVNGCCCPQEALLAKGCVDVLTTPSFLDFDFIDHSASTRVQISPILVARLCQMEVLKFSFRS